MTRAEKVVLDPDDVRRTLARIGHEIVERTGGGDLALVGVHTRGAPLARRLHAQLTELLDQPIGLGDLDIAFYRDDIVINGSREVRSTHLDEVRLDDKTVVLVDDVISTGRTVRAAIEALFAYGRPARVQLAVLVDRGHRELPLRPDYVGKNLPTSASERVNVRLQEIDGTDAVVIAA